LAHLALGSVTGAAWFAQASADLGALLSDHLHCERKAAENALSLVRRYPHHRGLVAALTRMAHEETSHLAQVAGIIERRGWVVRPDTPNRYARGLLAAVRPRDPYHLLDELLIASFIEARSRERLSLLGDGFGAAGDRALSDFYHSLASAEERHAGLFVDLARPLISEIELCARLAELAEHETKVLAALPMGSRIH